MNTLPPSRKRNAAITTCAGFSLAEIAIALFVLALGLLAVVSLFPAAVKFGTDTTVRAQATNVARSAEAYLLYKGVIPSVESNNQWRTSASLGRFYSYPVRVATGADTVAIDTDGDGTYSWNALIFRGGETPAGYVTSIEKLYLVQLRIYRSYPLRPRPVEIFEVFVTK